MIVNALAFVAGIAIFWIGCLLSNWAAEVLDRTPDWLTPGALLLVLLGVIMAALGLFVMAMAVVELFIG